MGTNVKRISAWILAVALCAAAWPVQARAAATLYEYRETTLLNQSVTYEKSRQMTDAGMLDVYILRVPLSNPYISVSPVDSQKELGLKEPASALLAGAGAIAGTNGDFFGMAGSYSVPFGPEVSDGRLKAVTDSLNESANEFAAFFMDGSGHPFMRYVNSKIVFLTNNVVNVNIGSYNKIGAVCERPVIIDRQAMTDTAALDKRLTGLAKVVVENDRIAYVSERGETVSIPENGYVVIIPASITDYRARFWVGDSAILRVTDNSGINYDAIQSAIGGGGLILSSGQVVHDKGAVPTGRQPRTAIGITRDGRSLILMTVDGRTHSIGATHDEMANMLLKYGAYDAMHLDGGGSATMVIKEPASGDYEVVNTVSDGAERRIINALGVFDRSPVGDMKKLAVRLAEKSAFVGAAVEIDVFGQDEYGHRLELPPDAGLVLTSRSNGVINGTTYIPRQAGTHVIEASYNGYTAQNTLQVYDIAELQCETAAIKTLEGLQTVLSFSGLTATGEPVPADNAVTVKVVPPQLGVWEDGAFMALSPGTGYLECTVNGVNTYVPLTVGGFGQPVNAFNGGATFSFSGYPATVTGSASVQMMDGRRFARMDYRFAQSSETQAAYLTFDPPLAIAGKPVALRMNVFGDGSGNWLRGRVKDAEGNTHAIDFTFSVDFNGWQSVTALLPEAAPGPFALERIYLASVNAEYEHTGTLYFDNPEALYVPDYNLNTPEGQKFTDPLRQNLAGTTADGAYVFDVAAPEKAVYSAQPYGNGVVLTMTAKGGGLYAADAGQWAQFTTDMARAQDFVVILMDTDPMQFKQQKETELFHTALLTQKTLGKTVFVITREGGEAHSILKDGIRYISGAERVRFRVEGNQVAFDIGS